MMLRWTCAVPALADPDYVPGCSINPFITCGPAMALMVKTYYNTQER